MEALRQLPAKQRRTMTLHYVCDLTVEQIAGETGLSASTVKTHLVRGRTALSLRLADPRIEGGPRCLNPTITWRPCASRRPMPRRAWPGPPRAHGTRHRRRRFAVIAAAACLAVGSGPTCARRRLAPFNHGGRVEPATDPTPNPSPVPSESVTVEPTAGRDRHRSAA